MKDHKNHDIEYEEGIWVCLDCDVRVHPEYFCTKCKENGYDPKKHIEYTLEEN